MGEAEGFWDHYIIPLPNCHINERLYRLFFDSSPKLVRFQYQDQFIKFKGIYIIVSLLYEFISRCRSKVLRCFWVCISVHVIGSLREKHVFFYITVVCPSQLACTSTKSTKHRPSLGDIVFFLFFFIMLLELVNQFSSLAILCI